MPTPAAAVALLAVVLAACGGSGDSGGGSATSAHPRRRRRRRASRRRAPADAPPRPGLCRPIRWACREGRAHARAGGAPAVPRARPPRRVRERHTRFRCRPASASTRRTRPWRSFHLDGGAGRLGSADGVRDAVHLAAAHARPERHHPHGVGQPTPNVLGQFFTQWDVALDANCVGGYCKPADAIAFYIDGKASSRRSDRRSSSPTAARSRS